MATATELKSANHSYSVAHRASALVQLASQIRDQALAASTLAYISPEAAEKELRQAIVAAEQLGLLADED